MKSHLGEFTTKDLFRILGGPLTVLGLFAALMHAGAALKLLPAPRPALDTERTILLHQAQASRRPHDAEILLMGDSSCLMDVAARPLGEQLGRPVLNLGTFSFLDLRAYALLLRQYARANTGRLRAVVLLMHPEALRRVGSEGYYLSALTNFWNGSDGCRLERPAGWISCVLAADLFKGRILSRVLPVPLAGAYGRRYGFSRDLEDYLSREHGSAIDPEAEPLQGNAEYRLSPTLEGASRAFRSALPSGARLCVGISPAPEHFAGPRYPQLHGELLRQWAEWLQADVVLTELPPTLPDDWFVRATHLKESSVPLYTEKVARALAPHLR